MPYGMTDDEHLARRLRYMEPTNEHHKEFAEKYGITFGYQEPSFAALIPYTWDNTCSIVQSVWLSLKMLVTGQANLKDISGPVGIVSMMT